MERRVHEKGIINALNVPKDGGIEELVNLRGRQVTERPLNQLN
jgi:hypothetical protein